MRHHHATHRRSIGGSSTTTPTQAMRDRAGRRRPGLVVGIRVAILVALVSVGWAALSQRSPAGAFDAAGVAADRPAAPQNPVRDTGPAGSPSPQTPAPPGPTPTATAEPTANRTTSTSGAASVTRPSTTTAAQTTGRGTLCGASFAREVQGETYQAALQRVDGYYNGLEMLRIFYPRRPAPWPGKVNANKRTMVVSFKLDPNDVTAGTHDAYMRHWFATAPRDADIYWSFWHEPEDDIHNGRFSSAAYRAAWKRLRSLADRANNDRLKATLVLMGWSVSPASGRDWRDYYPGRSVIQALGWDVYNPGEEKGTYQDPEVMFRRVIQTSRAEKLPFGVAETGSYLINGDTGARRAAWLRAVATTLTEQDALFVAYFDLRWPSGDFRLRDAASMSAWREFCS